MAKNAGFTLLELIIIIVIIGIVAVSAVSRFANEETFTVRVEQENLISILQQAQQLAMAGQTTEFAILSGSPQNYRIRVGSPLANYSVGSVAYPQEVRAGISLIPSSLTLTYNSLGQPSATPTITISSTSGGSVNVCVEASGYARAC